MVENHLNQSDQLQNNRAKLILILIERKTQHCFVILLSKIQNWNSHKEIADKAQLRSVLQAHIPQAVCRLKETENNVVTKCPQIQGLAQISPPTALMNTHSLKPGTQRLLRLLR